MGDNIMEIYWDIGATIVSFTELSEADQREFDWARNDDLFVMSTGGYHVVPLHDFTRPMAESDPDVLGYAGQSNTSAFRLLKTDEDDQYLLQLVG